MAEFVTPWGHEGKSYNRRLDDLEKWAFEEMEDVFDEVRNGFDEWHWEMVRDVLHKFVEYTIATSGGKARDTV